MTEGRTAGLVLSARARVRVTDVARFRRWHVTGDYGAIVGSLIEVHSLVGLPRHYLAVASCGAGEIVLSRHRTKAAAIRSLRSALAPKVCSEK